MLLALGLAGCVSTTNLSTASSEAAAVSSQWESEIAALEAADQSTPPPRNGIVFVGSSSIRLWKTLAEDFPEFPVINHGFGGSQIIDSVHFAERLVLKHRPRQIVMYAGGNDINAGKAPEQVFADFRTFVAKVHVTLPRTRIAYISIAPNPARWAQVARVREANRLIAEFCATDRRLQFINVFPSMLGSDGQPRPEIFVEDRLHMNANGYVLWREAVRPYLVRK